MTEPLKLPDDPTIKDLAIGLQQTHDCLEQAREEIRLNTNALVVINTQNTLFMPGLIALSKGFRLGWKFGKWLGPVVIAAAIGAYVQSYMQGSAILAQSHQAAVASQASVIVSANGHARVSHQLRSLGAP